jgi:hypothetical protein
MEGVDHPASSAPGVEFAPSSPPSPGMAQGWSSNMPAIGLIVLAIALYVILADAAIETFVSGSPGRWITAGAVAVYAGVTALFWRRFSWATKMAASALVLLFLITLTAWLPDGVSHGIILLGWPTSSVLGLTTALAVLLAGGVLAASRALPPPVRWAAGVIAAYGIAAFVPAIITGSDYADLFHGASLWVHLPFWLQGTFIGALILVPAALVFQVAAGLRESPSQHWFLSRRGFQFAGLSAAVIVAVAGLSTPASLALTGLRINIPPLPFLLGPVIFASGQSGDQPIGQAASFQQGIKTVYAFSDFDGLTGDDTIDSIWYKGAAQLSERKFKVSEIYGAAVPKRGRLWFTLTLEQGAQPGGYFLQIHVNGIPTQFGILRVDAAQ